MKHRNYRVGVLFGGRSSEHEVSLASAQNVMDALQEAGHTVVPIGITTARALAAAARRVGSACSAKVAGGEQCASARGAAMKKAGGCCPRRRRTRRCRRST